MIVIGGGDEHTNRVALVKDVAGGPQVYPHFIHRTRGHRAAVQKQRKSAY